MVSRRRPRPPSVPGETFARWVVALSGSLVVGACMAFSFGNVLALGRHLGAPAYIAWCVAPAVDLTVVGLIVGIRHLSLNGSSDEELKKPRWMLTAAGLAMWALNVAYPLFVAGNWGAVAYDSVPPLLLLGWSEVGPWFLRRFRALPAPGTATATPAGSEPASERNTNGSALPHANGAQPAPANATARARANSRPRARTSTPDADADVRAQARAIYDDHVRTGRPLSGAELGRAVQMSPRWGQKRLAEFQATPPAPTAGAPVGNGQPPAPPEGGEQP